MRLNSPILKAVLKSARRETFSTLDDNMPISGLIVHLSENRTLQHAALAAMREHPALELGEQRRNQLALVVESACEEEDRLTWEWLHALPGVTMVVVAFVHFDEPDEEAKSQPNSLAETSLPPSSIEL